jgi:hypothetical protein
MMSTAKWSPARRGVPNLDEKIARLEAFESWRSPTQVNFERILGADEWEAYWHMCEQLIGQMADCQRVADRIKSIIASGIGAPETQAQIQVVHGGPGASDADKSDC